MKRILYLLLLPLAASVHGQSLAVVDDDFVERVFHLNQMEYFIDTTNTLTIDVVSGQEYVNTFRRHDSYQNKDFVAGSSYWIRFPVKYDSDSEKSWVIEFYDQTIDRLDVFIPDDDGTFRPVTMGDHYEF